MNKIDCHSSTPKQDLVAFVKEHKGGKIELHYENNIYSGWGDDSVHTFDTNIGKDYEELLKTIETHYIHGIKCE